MNRLDFFRESMRNLKTVGTVTRSSPALCKGMIKPIDFQKAKVVVELGAGDGVVTKHILKALRPDAKLLVFEVNAQFCNKIREIKDDRMIVIEDSAENIENHLHKLGLQQVDHIISAIPFVSLPVELCYSIVRTCKKILPQKGLFVQIHYSLVMKKVYKSVFGNIDVRFVPLNFPPAFVLVCEKRQELNGNGNGKAH